VADRTCTVDTCEKPQLARGWCSAHWTRWKRHGSPTARLRGEVVGGCRICATCGVDKPVEDYGRRSDSWCRPCANAYQLAYKNARYVPKPKWTAACEVCGAEFLADKRQRFTCSTACKKIGINRRNWKHVQKRRMAVRSATVEVFNSREVFERDGWVCGLCDGAIDKHVRAPHPSSPSVDHIVPIALGGGHSLANVQAAHLGCNVRKGARLIAKVG
jgi:5-methylcytosine-specific restriction endonuclease McrA